MKIFMIAVWGRGGSRAGQVLRGNSAKAPGQAGGTVKDPEGVRADQKMILVDAGRPLIVDRRTFPVFQGCRLEKGGV